MLLGLMLPLLVMMFWGCPGMMRLPEGLSSAGFCFFSNCLQYDMKLSLSFSPRDLRMKGCFRRVSAGALALGSLFKHFDKKSRSSSDHFCGSLNSGVLPITISLIAFSKKSNKVNILRRGIDEGKKGMLTFMVDISWKGGFLSAISIVVIPVI